MISPSEDKKKIKNKRTKKKKKNEGMKRKCEEKREQKMEKRDHETSWNKSMYFGAYKNWRTFFCLYHKSW